MDSQRTIGSFFFAMTMRVLHRERDGSIAPSARRGWPWSSACLRDETTGGFIGGFETFYELAAVLNQSGQAQVLVVPSESTHIARQNASEAPRVFGGKHFRQMNNLWQVLGIEDIFPGSRVAGEGEVGLDVRINLYRWGNRRLHGVTREFFFFFLVNLIGHTALCKRRSNGGSPW